MNTEEPLKEHEAESPAVPQSWKHEVLVEGKQFIGHLAAIVAGTVMMVIGLGMGVTMVLLPIGLPVGLAGVVLLVWGLFGYATKGRIQFRPAYDDPQYAEYLAEIRQEVCSKCIERPPGGPPCFPRGKRCGVELNLPRIVEAVHQVHSGKMEPYERVFHDLVCTQCPNRPTDQCPCPMEYLLILAVQAIEAVDERHQAELATP